MFDLPDPITGLVSLFVKKAAASKVGQRLELLLEMSIAGTISFLFTYGVTVLSSGSVKAGIATAAMVAALCMAVTFGASANSKGLTIALPSAEQKEQMDTNISTIHRS